MTDYQDDPRWSDEAFAADAAALIAHFDCFIEKNYGPRCPEHESGCPVCTMWEHRDVLAFRFKP